MQVVWLGQKLSELLLGLAATASGQRVGGACEAAQKVQLGRTWSEVCRVLWLAETE